MKRPPMPHRTHPLGRHQGLAKVGKPVGPRNAKRRASEFTRCYGSRERVAFVKSLGCIYCVSLSPILLYATAGKCDNAHTVSGGKGRKADASTIIPLCRSHHRMYDEHRGPMADPALRESLKGAAAFVEAKWQSYAASRGLGRGE